MHACDLNACTNLHCSRRMFTLAAPRSCAVTSSTNAFNGVGRHHAPLLPRSNPHSARHDRVPLPAVSFLGGFRTPAPSLGVRGPSVIGRHPKPFTIEVVHGLRQKKRERTARSAARQPSSCPR